jgi:OOP family OmpA-OmpF porin
MKKVVLAFGFGVLSAFGLKAQTVTEDKEWTSQAAFLKGSSEADYIIRIGDVDNLNFGWPESFDPFCGRLSDSHPWPTEIIESDLPGMDRIMVSSKFKGENKSNCLGDGYSASVDLSKSAPVNYNLPTDKLKGVEIKNAYLQLFIDDFQAPSMCSRFTITLNGKRFAEGERMLNAIDQTGPVGKLITIPLPEEYYSALVTQPVLAIRIDESVGAADGWAIDFIRLLINRNRANTCKGSARGTVREKGTDRALSGVRVSTSENMSTVTDAEGNFMLTNIPTGFEVLTASMAGFNDGYGNADVGQGDDNEPITIYLEKGKTIQFDDRKMNVGEAINLNTILFDQGKWDLKPASYADLDKVVAFLRSNPSAEIELNGHTSSEGEAGFNRSLSYKRVNSCKAYVVSKGIDASRIVAKGFGPDRPVAPNDTEENRTKNRRVEMRLTKI